MKSVVFQCGGESAAGESAAAAGDGDGTARPNTGTAGIYTGDCTTVCHLTGQPTDGARTVHTWSGLVYSKF